MPLWVAVRATAVPGVYSRLCPPLSRAAALRVAGTLHGIVPYNTDKANIMVADESWVRWPIARQPDCKEPNRIRCPDA